MEMVMKYVKPELLIVAIVLYFLETWLLQSKIVPKRYISLINGGIGILICGIYVVATCTCHDRQGFAAAVFTIITQGILVAGLSTYVRNIINDNKKEQV